MSSRYITASSFGCITNLDCMLPVRFKSIISNLVFLGWRSFIVLFLIFVNFLIIIIIPVKAFLFVWINIIYCYLESFSFVNIIIFKIQIFRYSSSILNSNHAEKRCMRASKRAKAYTSLSNFLAAWKCY